MIMLTLHVLFQKYFIRINTTSCSYIQSTLYHRLMRLYPGYSDY